MNIMYYLLPNCTVLKLHNQNIIFSGSQINAPFYVYICNYIFVYRNIAILF